MFYTSLPKSILKSCFILLDSYLFNWCTHGTAKKLKLLKTNHQVVSAFRVVAAENVILWKEGLNFPLSDLSSRGTMQNPSTATLVGWIQLPPNQTANLDRFERLMVNKSTTTMHIYIYVYVYTHRYIYMYIYRCGAVIYTCMPAHLKATSPPSQPIPPVAAAPAPRRCSRPGPGHPRTPRSRPRTNSVRGKGSATGTSAWKKRNTHSEDTTWSLHGPLEKWGHYPNLRGYDPFFWGSGRL